MVKKIWTVCGIILCCMSILLVFKYAQLKRVSNVSRDRIVTANPIGGSFTLVDENGDIVTDRTYGNTKRLIFFGFTFCPSICPTELLKMHDVLNGLKDNAVKITPLFITIDPERDRPSVLKAYTDQFDDRIIGLTGTQEQIDSVIKSFRVYAARVSQDQGYTMDHSSFLYLMDENNQLITPYRMEMSVDDIIDDLNNRL